MSSVVCDRRQGRVMESSLRVLTLGRNTLRSVASVDSGLGQCDEFTHISLHSIYPPQLRVTVKYPREVDDASPSGMLSACDSDELFDKILQHYPSWEVFLDVKRITHYCKHALPRNSPVSQPRSRIIVKVRFSAWRMNVDTTGIQQAVEEVMNKTGDFYVEIRTEKSMDN